MASSLLSASFDVLLTYQEIAMKTGFSVMALGLKGMSSTTLLTLAVLAGLVGCAAPSSGPVSSADGTFTITREGNNTTAFSTNTAMATQQEAEAHCLKIGKQFKAIKAKVTTTRGYPVSELHYACN